VFARAAFYQQQKTEKHVVYERPHDGLLARESVAFASPAMIFTPQGLMLGAGTILMPAEGARKLKSLKGWEQQVLALLSAAYGTAVARSVLGNIERAAKCWSEGDDFTAHIHLAHTGLRALDDFPSAAHRLRMAKGALDHGASSRAVFEALRLDARYIDALEKLYNPAQPRVPAGNPDGGQWTSGDWPGGKESGENVAVGEKPTGEETRGPSLLSRMPLPAAGPAASFLSSLDMAQALELSLFALRMMTVAGGAAAVFGLLFIPSPDNVHVEEDVKGIPGLRYFWNRDETSLYLKYDRPGAGKRTVALRINDKDHVIDEEGQVVGKVVGGNKISIDTVAVLPDLVKQDEPRLCPAPKPDRPGSDQGKEYEDNPARQYEDFVKRIINPPPEGPTPSGYAYYLPNPKENGKLVSYDDCEWKTGRIMFEIKGENNAKMLNSGYEVIETNSTGKILKQSASQLEASGGRALVYVFAEEQAALKAQKLFDATDEGREKITIVHIPWKRKNP
jgi:hypothetical protein